MFHVYLKLVQSFVLSFPLNSFCCFQSTFFFTLPHRFVLKINSLTHSLRTVKNCFPLSTPVSAQRSLGPAWVCCSISNGKSSNSSKQPFQCKNTTALSSSARQLGPRAHLPSSLILKSTAVADQEFLFPFSHQQLIGYNHIW